MNLDYVHVFEVGVLLVLVGIFYFSPFELKVNEDDEDDEEPNVLGARFTVWLPATCDAG